MKQILRSVAASLRRPGKGRASSAPFRQARPQVESLEDRLIPNAAPIFTGDTFYLSNHTSHPDQLRVLWESPDSGLSTRQFQGVFVDNLRGMGEVVVGTITGTGAVTPGPGGVPISTITFRGSMFSLSAYYQESVSFTGQVYGSGYNPNQCNLYGNTIDGTVTEWGVQGGYWFMSTTFTQGTDWSACIG
jgi:hypothetical protein